MSKRKLTADEIEYILSFIKPQHGIPPDTANFIAESNKEKLRKQLVHQLIYPDAIEPLKNMVEKQWVSSRVQAGESVGVIGAQSIGEKQTQSSVVHDEKIIIKVNNNIITTTIGEYIDNEINQGVVLYMEHNSIVKIVKNVQILTVSRGEKIQWKHINEISKHPVGGDLIQITTKSGRSVTTTLSHSHLRKSEYGVVPILGSKLKLGDCVPVIKNSPIPLTGIQSINVSDYIESNANIEIPISNAFGWFLGAYLAVGKCEGNCVKLNMIATNNKFELKVQGFIRSIKIDEITLSSLITALCGDKNSNKKIPSFVFGCSRDFISNVTKGWMDGDKSGENYECKNMLEQFSILFSYFGIFGTIKKVGSKYSYDISETENNGSDVIWDEITCIKYIQERDYDRKYVYDFSVDGNETFALQSGIVVHNTLNTFHFTGRTDKTVTTGVPRVEELLNATKDPKTVLCKLRLKDKHNTIAEARETIGNQLVCLTFEKITKSYEIVMDKKPEKWYEQFKLIYGSNNVYTDCISLKINMDILYEYKLNMEDIYNVISSQYSDMTCIFSPDNIGQLDIFVETTNIDLPESRLIFVNTDNAKEIYLEEVVQPLLAKIVICGIQGIEGIYFTGPNDLETDGSNYSQLLGLPFIDYSQAVSNNIWEIYHTLGIEAARQFLIEEFMSIMEGINVCHIQLLAEKMTFLGTITSITRYSMRNEESGPLQKCSFEESLDNFCRAGVYGQMESTKGVSASIICGKIAQIGTGMCELKMNPQNFPEPDVFFGNVKEKQASIPSENQTDRIINKKVEKIRRQMSYLEI